MNPLPLTGLASFCIVSTENCFQTTTGKFCVCVYKPVYVWVLISSCRACSVVIHSSLKEIERTYMACNAGYGIPSLHG